LRVELNQGDRVGDYTVEGVLGRGGMAHVYTATAPDGETVALKLILEDLMFQDTFRRRFELETTIAQRLTHPNVVAVLDSGVQDNLPWLTQELIRGGSLMERLENGPLDVEDAVRVIEQVGAGLDAVHAVGLVHRDLKPANILLREDGTACVTDFGLARDTESDTRLTRPGQTLGSMDYMAPEQIRAEDVGPYTDVYGLGCVLYECVIGTPPFADRPGMAVLRAHLDDMPPDPSERRSDIAPKVADAIMAALAKVPADRPASASAYAKLVREAL
jgi:serine/threonine protein kinase